MIKSYFFCINFIMVNQNNIRKDDIMRTVPAMVSTKDLSYIEDMCNWIYTLSKKATHFSKEVTDSELKDGLESLAAKLKNHYEKLLGVLKAGGIFDESE